MLSSSLYNVLSSIDAPSVHKSQGRRLSFEMLDTNEGTARLPEISLDEISLNIAQKRFFFFFSLFQSDTFLRYVYSEKNAEGKRENIELTWYLSHKG